MVWDLVIMVDPEAETVRRIKEPDITLAVHLSDLPPPAGPHLPKALQPPQRAPLSENQSSKLEPVRDISSASKINRFVSLCFLPDVVGLNKVFSV